MSSSFQAAKEAKARIAPWEMFKRETDKYSKFDDQVKNDCAVLRLVQLRGPT